jgi:cytoskeleton protein RodZ
MARLEAGDGLRIGEVLKRARRRLGLDIRTVEQRTKIRIKYLRALENEQWELLPGHAYAKGFLRTYAQLLGVDADTLVEEYRRVAEAADRHPPGELRRPVRLGDPSGRGPRGAVAVVAVVAAVLGVFLVIGLLGDENDDDENGRRAQPRAQQRAEERREERRREAAREAAAEQQESQVTLRLVSNVNGLPVCLLADGDRVLIDGQVLSLGSEERYTARGFELRFLSGIDRGQVDVFIDGERARLPETFGPVAFRIEPADKLRPVELSGTECP